MDELIELIVGFFLFHKKDNTGCEKKRKQIRMFQSLAAIIAIFVAFVYESMYIACWFGMLAGTLEFMELSMLVYKDYKLKYPAERKSRPCCFYQVWLWLYEDDRIPKCLIIQNMVIISIFFVCSILCIGLCVSDFYISIWKLLLVYYILGIIVLLFTNYEMYLYIFMTHFKRINKHNIRYALVPIYNSSYKWPVAKILGMCKVIKCMQMNGRMYAEIQMRESGELYEDVLLTFEIDKKRTYKLCEICEVKYLA